MSHSTTLPSAEHLQDLETVIQVAARASAGMEEGKRIGTVVAVAMRMVHGWMTVHEASVYLGVNEQTVRHLIRTGAFRSSRRVAGSHITFVSVADVAAYRGH